MTKTKKGNLKNCFTDSLSTQVIHDIDLKYKFRFFSLCLPLTWRKILKV